MSHSRNRLPSVADLRALSKLALPVIVVQLGTMAMGVVDSIMAGHRSAEALSAVALGNLYVFFTAMFGMGALMSVDPLISQAFGAGDRVAMRRAIGRGLLLALGLTLPSVALLLGSEQVLVWLEQPKELIPVAAGFARISAFGILPFLCFVVLRQSLQAMSQTRPIVVVIGIANLINLLLNWLLIYGHWGFPSLGALGSAWSTVIARVSMLVCLAALSWPTLKPLCFPLEREIFQLRPMLQLVRIGVPIGAQFTLEYGIFAAVGLMMGRISSSAVASHQVAINLASLAFMLPLGTSSAAAVLVGQAIGRGDPDGAKRAARAALVASAGAMCLSAAAFLVVPQTLAGIYTEDQAIRNLASTLLPIAGFFQVFDGLQVVSIGVLRGIGDTRTPMLIAIVSYWCIALPASLLLGFTAKLGPTGFWWGLVIGLGAAALLLLWRVISRFQKPLERIAVETHAH